MPFDAARPNRSLLARVSFGAAWLELADPSEAETCDAHDVRARMAMYRLLIERCNRRGGFGAHDALCPFWGYASQLAWQHESGRLAAPAGVVTESIDPASWWGACNYALSVVPYQAAMQLGIVPALVFPPPPAAYGLAQGRWRDALMGMSAAGPGEDLDAMRLAVWRAHLASIETAIERHAALYRALPRAERRFARGWVRMVELFAAAGWRTDLLRLVDHKGALPSHVLDGDDRLADLAEAERRTVRQVFVLADRPDWRWALELRVWRRIMRARRAREDAKEILAALLGTSRRAWPVRVRALTYALSPWL